MSGTITPQGFLQAIPPAGSTVLNRSGTMETSWYQFFQTIWQMVASGTFTSFTLQGAHAAAILAQDTANGAVGSVADESARAQAVEQSLQNQINTLDTTVAGLAGLQGQINNLQTQINNINSRLTAAGIP